LAAQFLIALCHRSTSGQLHENGTGKAIIDTSSPLLTKETPHDE